MRFGEKAVFPRHSKGLRTQTRGSYSTGGILLMAALLFVRMTAAGGPVPTSSADKSEPITLIVLDPLSKELACACVKGYGQRDYRKVATLLERALQQRVSIEFSDDLAESLSAIGPGREVIVAGEDSLVAHGAKKGAFKLLPVCELTDRNGDTTVTASFVARSDDRVNGLKDINGRKVFMGVPQADALHAAALSALHAAQTATTPEPEQRGSYAEATLDMLDSSSTPPPVAVIPSYAPPLLEGCGSVKPGSFKVFAKTAPVPFIKIFVSENIALEKQQQITKVLLGIKHDANLLKAMESREGFKPVKAASPAKKSANADASWPDWRGPHRDAHVPRLPKRLPPTARIVWKKPAMPDCLAGLSISGDRLILAERDFAEEHDVYRCLSANDGKLLWCTQFPARGKLDYGQSPRATPVIDKENAYFLGAFGGLRCVNLSTGKVLWERDLPRDFNAKLPTWGMCSTPLLVDGMLIVNPGGTNASLAALDCATGRTRWTTPGLPAAYSAFICGEFGGRRQIVGYDQVSVGGWDVKTGRRIWQLVPPQEGDFNVPTPVAADGGLILSTENNGTRFYRFDESGCIIPKPEATFAGLAPATASPVLTGGRLFGSDSKLYCLDLASGLKPIWQTEEESLGEHATFIADNERVLVITLNGELMLLDSTADRCVILSRQRVFADEVEVYSHPALVGTRLYARGGSSVLCVNLGTD